MSDGACGARHPVGLVNPTLAGTFTVFGVPVGDSGGMS